VFIFRQISLQKVGLRDEGLLVVATFAKLSAVFALIAETRLTDRGSVELLAQMCALAALSTIKSEMSFP